MEAMKLFQSTDSKGVKPNNVIYGMMIYGYGWEGSSYKALKLIMEMRKSGLVPNIASYGLIDDPSSLQRREVAES
jgi:pentatricopeptide repeat protein